MFIEFLKVIGVIIIVEFDILGWLFVEYFLVNFVCFGMKEVLICVFFD